MTSLSPPLSDDDTIMTPATIAGSDGSFSSSSSPRYAPAPHRRWSTSIIRRPSSSGIWVNSPPCGKKVTVTKKLSSSSLVFPAQQQPPVKGAMVAAETKKHKLQTRNLLKSAVHKLRKRRNKHSAAGLEAAAAAQTSKKTQQAPPNIESLGIEPRLLEKWKSLKELQKQGNVNGEKKQKMVSRGTATLVVMGLLAGSYAWLKDKSRQWIDENKVLLAAFVASVVVAGSCMLILERCG